MNSLDRLKDYLGSLERRLRLMALSRGAAVTAAVALGRHRAGGAGGQRFRLLRAQRAGIARSSCFSPWPLALAAALIASAAPARTAAAPRAKPSSSFPQFEERLLTFTERLEQNPADPFLPLLAADSLAGGRRSRAAAGGRGRAHCGVLRGGAWVASPC